MILVDLKTLLPLMFTNAGALLAFFLHIHAAWLNIIPCSVGFMMSRVDICQDVYKA